MKLRNIKQRPSEDWSDYVARLERERLRARGEQEEKDAKALEMIGDEQNDQELKIVARAKRAAAQEFYRAVKEMERGVE